MFNAGDIIGGYRLEERRSGGLADETWLAESDHDDLPVLVQVFAAEATRTSPLARSLFTHAKLEESSNVVPTLDVLVENERLIAVSPWVAENLRALPKPISPVAAAQMALEILNGLIFLHDRNVIHGLLAPSSVRLKKNVPTIANYGTAAWLTANLDDPNVFEFLPYRAPAALDGKYTPQSDFWSLGVILFELVAGYLPFPQQNRRDLISAIRTLIPDPLPPNVPGELKAIIYRLLERSPSRAYKSGDEIRGDLAYFLSRKSSVTEPGPEVSVAPAAPVAARPAAPSSAPTFGAYGKAEPSGPRNNGRAIVIGVLLFCLLSVGGALAVIKYFDSKANWNMKSKPRPGAPLGPTPTKSPNVSEQHPYAPATLAKTITVGPSDADYTDLAQAVEKAPTGARIVVKPGTYTAGFTIDKDLEILGQGSPESIILESRKGPCVLNKSGKSLIRGLTLNGKGATEGASFFAVSVEGGSLTLEGCTLQSDTLATVAVAGAATSLFARDCTIRDGKASGIGVWAGAKVEATGCRITGNRSAGVVVNNNGSVVLTKCTVADNALWGLRAYEGGRAKVTETTFRNNAKGAYANDPSGTIERANNVGE